MPRHHRQEEMPRPPHLGRRHGVQRTREADNWQVPLLNLELPGAGCQGRVQSHCQLPRPHRARQPQSPSCRSPCESPHQGMWPFHGCTGLPHHVVLSGINGIQRALTNGGQPPSPRPRRAQSPSQIHRGRLRPAQQPQATWAEALRARGFPEPGGPIPVPHKRLAGRPTSEAPPARRMAGEWLGTESWRRTRVGVSPQGAGEESVPLERVSWGVAEGDATWQPREKLRGSQQPRLGVHEVGGDKSSGEQGSCTPKLDLDDERPPLRALPSCLPHCSSHLAHSSRMPFAGFKSLLIVEEGIHSEPACRCIHSWRT